MAYTFDSTEEGEGRVFSDDLNQQSEFTVPQTTSSAATRTVGYTIGPLDLLDIEVFRVEDLKRSVRVDDEGKISFPLVGTIPVAGKTVAQVEDLIEERLKEEYLQDPHVSVFIREYESQKVTINGWVEAPGVFPLKGRTTLIQALSMAKGIKRLGDPTEVVIFREKPGVGTTGYKINFEDVQAGLMQDPVLLSNDIIVVPENGSKAAFEDTTKTIRTFLGFLPFLIDRMYLMRSNPPLSNQHSGLPAVPHDSHAMSVYHARGPMSDQFDDDDVIDLREYWNIIWARKGTVLIFVVMALIAATISTSMKPKVYKSALTMQIERFSNATLNAEGTGAGYDYWAYEDFYQTQFELIKSHSLAERVVKDLDITSFEQIYGKPRPSFYTQLKNSIFSEGMSSSVAAENNNTSPDAINQQVEVSSVQLASGLRGGLSVKPIENSRLVTLSFDSTSAEMATRIVNAYADSFMQMNLERCVADSTYAQSFLNEQIKQVRANLEDSESKLVEYANEKQIADLDQRLSSLQQKLQALNNKLLDVEAGRIEAQAAFEEMNDNGSKGLSTVVDDQLIKTYKQTLVRLESEYARKLKVFKPAYPEMKQLKGQITGLQNKIDEEVVNSTNVLETTYSASAREETMLKKRIAEVNENILDLRKRTTDYQVLKRDVESNLILYDSLLQQAKEISVASGINANNISVVDYALVPAAPYKPNLQKNLTMALIFGLLGGIGLAFLFNKLDDTIKTGSDLEDATNLSLLGIVPEVDKNTVKGAISLMTFEDPTSAISEAYRSFKTALSLSAAGGYPKILQITSSGVGEGKTTTAIGVALTFIQSGAKVLVIDCDLRNPSVHKDLGIPNEGGLTNYLAGEKTLSQICHKSKIHDNLFIVTAGPQSPNPAELLASQAMNDFLERAENKFDIVIIDGPPVLGLADALVLSDISYGTVLVVDSGETRKGVLSDSLRRLHGVQANILGTILTKYNQGHSEYKYLYNYYGTSAESRTRERLAS